MVAVEVAMGRNAEKLMDLAPGEAARVLVQNADEAWLAELQRSLDQWRAHADLDHILGVWNLSQSDAAELFGVTRQAISKWRAQGAPTSRIDALADLSAATDILVRYLKRDRIPAVVRRPSDELGGRSLLDLVGAGRFEDVLGACRRMFQFGDAHA
jgi:predicted XRE-type DNA-binding protein